MSSKTLWWIVGGSVALALLLVATSATTNVPFRMMSSTVSSPGYGGMMGYATDESTGAYEYDLAVAPEMAVRDSYGSPIAPPSPEEPSAGQTAAEVDQKIIKTGYLDLAVDDVGETASKLSALATGKGGFVQETSVSERADGTHFGNVTVRVPSEQFESTMTEIKAYAASVTTESSQGQDVTEQFTDLEAQLRNAKAQEEEYLKILERATTVEEILQVQSYLSSVRYTVESLEGRIQYLENRTSYSTISVAMSEEPTVRIPTKDFRFGATISEAGQALVAIVQNLAVAAIWLVVVGGGILVPVALVVWAVRKLMIKRRAR